MRGWSFFKVGDQQFHITKVNQSSRGPPEDIHYSLFYVNIFKIDIILHNF